MNVYKWVAGCGVFMCFWLAVSATATELVVKQPEGEVARAQFTTAIVDREPVDNVVILGAEATRIYFFSDLRHLEGQRVVHRWEYGGRVEAEVAFDVTSNRWRAHSSKQLDSSKYGVWTVVVVNEQGWPLKAALFEYSEGVTKLLDE